MRLTICRFASFFSRVFFDITLGGEPLGRITFELFKDVVPKTADNFRQFCTGESKSSAGRPQGYKGSKFHRIVRVPVALSWVALVVPGVAFLCC